MKNHTRLSCLAIGLTALAASIMTTGCGSGWSPLAALGSSPGNTVSFKINTRDPVNNVSNAEPVDEIQFTFNKDVDVASVRAHGTSPSIFLFDELPAAGYKNHINDLIWSVAGDPDDKKEITLVLREPLRLLHKYYIRFELGKIRMANSNKTLKDDNDWEFTVRDGVLGDVKLISFLQPTSAIRYLDNLKAAIVIEGRRGSGEFVMGFAKAEKDEGFGGLPIIVNETFEETNQNGLHIFENENEKMALAWMQGKPFCSKVSGMCPPTPCNQLKGDLFVSSSTDEGESWSPPWPISSGINGPNLSWPVRVVSTDSELVTAWWAWVDTPPTKTSPTNYGYFDHFGIYSNILTKTGSWTGAIPIATAQPGQRQEFGWPFLAKVGNKVYALWGEALTKNDLYDKDDADSLTGYWLGVYDSSAMTSWSAQRIHGTPMNLPRPTDFVISESEMGADEGVILARTGNAGPRTFVIDLENSLFMYESTYVPPGGETLAPAGSLFQPPKDHCGFSRTRAVVKAHFPRALSVDPEVMDGERIVLVSWPASSGNVYVNKFDLVTMGWVDAPAIPSMGSAQLSSGPSLMVDLEGMVTMTWATIDSMGKFKTVKAARAKVETLDWQSLKGSIPENTFNLSDPVGSCAGGVFSAAHSTGRILFGWTNNTGGAGSCTVKHLSSTFRSFK